MNKQARKLFSVGDAAVGKTSLYIVLTRGEFPLENYIPTFFKGYVLDVDTNGELIELALWDPAANADFEDCLRPLSYPETNAFLICFSIVWPYSLENVLAKWYPLIKYFGAEQVPRFLVGCKKDLRNDERSLQRLAERSLIPVSTGQGREIAKVIGAEYFECSAKTGEGVRELFARVMEGMEANKSRYYSHRSYHGFVMADVSLFDAQRQLAKGHRGDSSI